MISIRKQYEATKRRANEFMINGEIAKYLEALIEMKKYKRLMIAVVSN